MHHKYYIIVASILAIWLLLIRKEAFFGKIGRTSVKMYEDKAYGGKSLDINSMGSYKDISTLFDGRDNTVSSMIVSPGYKVIFYDEKNFKGTPGEFTEGRYEYIGDYWNDKISSFKVIKVTKAKGKSYEPDAALEYYNTNGTLPSSHAVALLKQSSDNKLQAASVLKYSGYKTRLAGQGVSTTLVSGIYVNKGYKLLVFKEPVDKFDEVKNAQLERREFKAGLHTDLGDWVGQRYIIVAEDT